MKVKLIIEKSDGDLWGRLDGNGDLHSTTVGSTTQEVIANMRDLIAGYKANEGINDKYWKKVNVDELQFELVYDLEAFFDEHNYLNISNIAKMAELNPGLVRQYASGVKHPSLEQVRKIEKAIHDLAKELLSITLI